MPDFAAPYADALLFSAAFIILILIQNFVATYFRNVVEPYKAGEALPANHDSATYRQVRSFENSLENGVPYLGAMALAILAGASPTWVYWTALIFLIARIGHWACYSANIPLARTVCFLAGFAATMALAVVTALPLI